MEAVKSDVLYMWNVRDMASKSNGHGVGAVSAAKSYCSKDIDT